MLLDHQGALLAERRVAEAIARAKRVTGGGRPDEALALLRAACGEATGVDHSVLAMLDAPRPWRCSTRRRACWPSRSSRKRWARSRPRPRWHGCTSSVPWRWSLPSSSVATPLRSPTRSPGSSTGSPERRQGCVSSGRSVAHFARPVPARAPVDDLRRARHLRAALRRLPGRRGFFIDLRLHEGVSWLTRRSVLRTGRVATAKVLSSSVLLRVLAAREAARLEREKQLLGRD